MNNENDSTVHRKHSSYPSTVGHSEVPGQSIPLARIHKTMKDLSYLICITVMLVWPWIFFGIAWFRDGIQISNNRLVNFIIDHPHSITFLITFLGTIVRLAIGFLFSNAVLRFCQEWMMERPLNLFHISLMSGFRNQKLPWGRKDLLDLCRSSKVLRLALVALCWATFTIVPSSVTSLLGPAPFDKTQQLEGNELDFSSTAPDCITWLNNQTIPNICDWETYNGTNFTTCLGQNQMVDVLESGRGNILSLLTNNSQSLDFSQLGASSGLKFLGPIRGVLPIGPNGVTAFNTLANSPMSDPKKEGILSYNYTLNTQGLHSTVSCEYTPQSPIHYYGVPNASTYVIQYNGTCSQLGQVEISTDIGYYISRYANNTLMFWACKSPPSAAELSYFVYLRGINYYETEIGNITCTLSPIQPAIFPLTYQSIPGTFHSSNSSAVSTTQFSGLIDQPMLALGGLISEAQTGQANLVAESVFTFGIKSFNLPLTGGQDPRYLPLYEAMIQGIIEYLAAYVRLLTSTGVDRPDSCTRIVTGTLSYSVIGWSVDLKHIGYLMPITIVNLASLIIMILAILRTNNRSYPLDPLDPRNLALAEHSTDPNDPTNEWKDCLTYHDRHTVVGSKAG